MSVSKWENTWSKYKHTINIQLTYNYLPINLLTYLFIYLFNHIVFNEASNDLLHHSEI